MARPTVQIQGYRAQDRHLHRTPPVANTVAVFATNHILDPVKLVLDAPMTPNTARKISPTQHQVAHEVSVNLAQFPLHPALAVYVNKAAKASPRVIKLGLASRVNGNLPATVATMSLLSGLKLTEGGVVTDGELNVRQQAGLVGFNLSHIMIPGLVDEGDRFFGYALRRAGQSGLCPENDPLTPGHSAAHRH